MEFEIRENGGSAESEKGNQIKQHDEISIFINLSLSSRKYLGNAWENLEKSSKVC